MRCLGLVFLLLGGCTSRIYLSPLNSESPVATKAKTFRVVNPQLSEEYAILKASGIFELTDDPNCMNLLELHEMESVSWICGNVFMLTTMTLGFVPSQVPLRYKFRFELQGQDSQIMTFQIQVTEKYSLYERFKWWKPKPHEVLGKALSRAYSEAETEMKTNP